MFTIVLSSKDRVEFVEKQLKSLKFQKFTGQLIICDVSTDENFFILSKKIENFSTPSFDILLERHPPVSIHESIKLVLDKIIYDFVMWLPDDDFLVIKDVKEAIDFLSENEDYSACGGRGIYINFEKNITTFTDINFQNLDNVSSYKRVIEHINNYQVINYSIQRKKNFVNLFKQIPKDIIFIYGSELIPAHYLVSVGKINFLDNLFVVRTLHDHRYLIDNFSHFFNDNWSFTNNFLIKLLCHQINLNEKDVNLNLLQNDLINAFKNFHMRQLNKLNLKKNLNFKLKKYLDKIFPEVIVSYLRKINYKYSKKNITNIKNHKYFDNFLQLGEIFKN